MHKISSLFLHFFDGSIFIYLLFGFLSYLILFGLPLASVFPILWIIYWWMLELV